MLYVPERAFMEHTRGCRKGLKEYKLCWSLSYFSHTFRREFAYFTSFLLLAELAEELAI